MNSAYSQFTAPFNILPDVVYTNPTNGLSQFSSPFNILPDPNLIQDNPTLGQSQFGPSFNILPDPNLIQDNPTISNSAQFASQYTAAPGYTGNPTDAGFNPTIQTVILPNLMANAVVTNQLRPQFSTGSAEQQNATAWMYPKSYMHTNVSLKRVASNIFGFASLAAGSISGFPQIGQVGQSLTEGVENTLSGTYRTLPFNQLTNKIISGIESPVLYPDFRSRLTIAGNSSNTFGQQALGYLTSRRLDGASAAIRLSPIAAIYAAASATPVGPYSVFNLDGAGKTGYGWGEHDHPNAIRSDFTMRSHIAKRWKYLPAAIIGAVYTSDEAGNNLGDYREQIQPPKGEFVPTNDPLELATPFRGDKVTVIDFGKRSLSQAYLWKSNTFNLNGALGAILNKTGITQDFIKFYFTGPKLQAGNDIDTDDIIVFRAVITSLSDSFKPSWNAAYMVGRADPNYIYNGFSRDVSLNFDIYATDRDEMQSIYRKLNGLAGFTAPTYNSDSIAMEAPWMRLTLGDLFTQTPVVLSSLSIDYGVTDAPWEINIEQDPNMMQVPFKIGVTCQFNVISDFLPQKGGRFYTLAKRFATDGTPIAGNDNWLSDAKQNISFEEQKKLKSRSKVVGKSSGNKKTETFDKNAVNNILNTLNNIRII